MIYDFFFKNQKIKKYSSLNSLESVGPKLEN